MKVFIVLSHSSSREPSEVWGADVDQVWPGQETMSELILLIVMESQELCCKVNNQLLGAAWPGQLPLIHASPPCSEILTDGGRNCLLVQ